MMQKLKVHQEAITNNIKELLKTNCMQTLQYFSLTEDQENYDPNVNMVNNYQLPAQM